MIALGAGVSSGLVLKYRQLPEHPEQGPPPSRFISPARRRRDIDGADVYPRPLIVHRPGRTPGSPACP
jgi:hypothetical protein